MIFTDGERGCRKDLTKDEDERSTTTPLGLKCHLIVISYLQATTIANASCDR